MKTILNVEYGGIHAAYWMYYGVVASFNAAFLLARGYTNSEIGIILAVASVLSVLIQPLLADLADRSRRLDVIGVSQISTLVLMAAGAGLFLFREKSLPLWLLYVLVSAGLLALQPLLNSLCFKLEESGHHVNFGICRSCGSLGYALFVILLGVMVEKSGAGILPVAGEVTLGALLIILVLVKKSFFEAMVRKKYGENVIGVIGDYIDITRDEPDTGAAAAAGAIEAGDEAGKPVEAPAAREDINLAEFVRRNRLFVALNLAIIVLFFQNYIANNYMLQLVEGVGGDAADMGRIFSVMAFMEIPGLFFFEKIAKRFSLESLLIFSAFAFVAKFAVIYIAESVFMLYVAHIFQAVSFPIFLSGMVAYTDGCMSKGEAVKGQSLYTACITVSSVFAGVLGGIMLDMAGPKFMAGVSTISAVAGAVLVTLILQKMKKSGKQK